MRTRTALALLLLLPAAASAQDLDAAVSAVVRISGTRGETPVRGSGFVVSLDRDKATIVTASHVIEGVQQFEATFAVDSPSVSLLPVQNVSWADAKAACEYFGGRLPTEAEWEYAPRAGSQTAWSFGGNEKMLGEYAWYIANSLMSTKPHPVGTKKPNDCGLYDIYGNVSEWVADWYGTYPAVAQSEPTGPTAGVFRVSREGSCIPRRQP